jgi:hypothetical protein
VEFYKTKLNEYKWTLRISSKGVEFMGFAMGIIDASVVLLTETTRKLSETAEAPQQHNSQQMYDRSAEEEAMIQNYAHDNNHVMNNYPQLGDDYDPTMDFQDLLGQEMQVSPSATISADLSADETLDATNDVGSTYYGSLDGSEGGHSMGTQMGTQMGNHESFDFLPRPAGLWMNNALVNDQWPQ